MRFIPKITGFQEQIHHEIKQEKKKSYLLRANISTQLIPPLEHSRSERDDYGLLREEKGVGRTRG